MAIKFVSAEDNAVIQNLMGLYQHLVDDGDADGWADLYTEDGAFVGLAAGPPEGFVGREALKEVPRFNVSQGGGKFRHNICSFSAQYGETRDDVHARYYMIGTISPEGAGTSVVMQIDVRSHLVRVEGGWKIKTNRMAVV